MASKEPLDPRSTGRKRARSVLLKEVEEGERTFACECRENHSWHNGGIGSRCNWEPDKTRELGRGNNLDANHINKDWLDNDPVNLEWLCRRCHREKDRRTAKGVSAVEDEHGYLEGYV